ncbi:MAG: hypothetical protein ACYTG5_14870 [Planctomycetota bacterium]|jgi:hypothetical protein
MHKIPLPLLGLGLSLLPASLPAQEQVIIDELPGYYEFFMKAGKLAQIEAEEQRNAKIEEGELFPESVEIDLPDFNLPLAEGGELRFLDFKGRKNLMVVSFRSWW